MMVAGPMSLTILYTVTRCAACMINKIFVNHFQWLTVYRRNILYKSRRFKATLKGSKSQRYISTWYMFGPFPCGKNEVDGDVLGGAKGPLTPFIKIALLLLPTCCYLMF